MNTIIPKLDHQDDDVCHSSNTYSSRNSISDLINEWIMVDGEWQFRKFGGSWGHDDQVVLQTWAEVGLRSAGRQGIHSNMMYDPFSRYAKPKIFKLPNNPFPITEAI